MAQDVIDIRTVGQQAIDTNQVVSSQLQVLVDLTSIHDQRLLSLQVRQGRLKIFGFVARH